MLRRTLCKLGGQPFSGTRRLLGEGVEDGGGRVWSAGAGGGGREGDAARAGTGDRRGKGEADKMEAAKRRWRVSSHGCRWERCNVQCLDDVPCLAEQEDIDVGQAGPSSLAISKYCKPLGKTRFQGGGSRAGSPLITCWVKALSTGPRVLEPSSWSPEAPAPATSNATMRPISAARVAFC